MPDSPKCPHCGSGQTVPISSPTRLRAIVFYECGPCQRTFADKASPAFHDPASDPPYSDASAA